jgi:hypothetical protein
MFSCYSLEEYIMTFKTAYQKAVVYLLWLFGSFPGHGFPSFFFQSLLSSHSRPILVLGSWHILPRFIFSSFPRAVFLRGFLPEFILFFCCRASSSYSVYSNVGGDNHVVTFLLTSACG